ncbi:MAG TPA: hypothetical protein VMW83_14165 [Spirochaetia bacterium]|nr:hypothetical protein [Spirochaetia bacterium]
MSQVVFERCRRRVIDDRRPDCRVQDPDWQGHGWICGRTAAFFGPAGFAAGEEHSFPGLLEHLVGCGCTGEDDSFPATGGSFLKVCRVSGEEPAPFRRWQGFV